MSRLLFVMFIVASLGLGNPAVQAQPAKEITNSLGMKLVLIPKGNFLMGSPPSEEGRFDDERQHAVTISRDYYLGAYEVTQGQYLKVMGKNPSYFQGDKVAERHPTTGCIVKDVDSSNFPVEEVSWEDAVEFCRRLSSLPEERKTGRVYRLPTEAEWEYGSRAGRKTAYGFGNDSSSLDEYGWFHSNSSSRTHPVGQKKANAWGLYDLHGNVWEWCADRYGEYQRGGATDPTGPTMGSYRVNRGGCWSDGVASCRASDRVLNAPTGRWVSGGFRLALSFVGVPAESGQDRRK
jgi:formylglycine-generating enzyme required for sulfatase activity